MADLHPPLFPDELVSTAGEREILETFLDHYRDVVTRKVTGVSDEDARVRLVPSLTTLAGLVKHLRFIELEWFQQVLAGRVPGDTVEPDELLGSAGTGPAVDEFRVGPDERVDRLVAAYRAECARSRAVAAGFTLDDTVPHPRLGRVSLRWIYVHMIEETARHAGHADILRELTDGSTGT